MGSVARLLLLSVLCLSSFRPQRTLLNSFSLDENPQMMVLENEHMLLGFDTSHGLMLISLKDKTTGREYLPASRPASNTGLFLFRTNLKSNTFFTSYADLDIQQTTLSNAKRQLTVTAHAKDLPLKFSLTARLEQGQTAAILQLSVQSETGEPALLQFEYPKIQGFEVGSDPSTGMLPIEIGTVGPLAKRPTFESGAVDQRLGLSHTLNLMELADVYDANGGGFFVADLDGGPAPLQFSLSGREVVGRWTTILPPNGSVKLPRLAIGVHHQSDWHPVVDYYLSQHQWHFPDTPTWLREAGGLYAYGGEGGGGIYQQQKTITLKERIGSFDKLPQLLDEAQRLGTTVVYLYDYWQGAEEGNRPPYWNKGDYVPRADMGGPAAFKAGIANIHARGGRVILYVEPFIVFRYSELGKTVGEQWAGRDLNGNLYSQYPDNYTMCSRSEAWQDYVTKVSQKLVREYGADGIYLDSWGWQWNWSCLTQQENQPMSAAAWNQGVLELTDQLRSAIRQINPEAVVLTESFNQLLLQHIDGALDASFAWHFDLNGGRLVSSPGRYAFPQANIFSNGRDLNQLNQVYVAGYNLALGPIWLEHADYIRKLLETRQRYGDALVYGKQRYQPSTGNEDVAAYFFEGSQTQVITVVNIGENDYQGPLKLEMNSAAQWQDVLSGERFTVGPDGLSLSVPAQTLRVLVPEAVQ
jgi:hypothetical protein